MRLYQRWLETRMAGADTQARMADTIESYLLELRERIDEIDADSSDRGFFERQRLVRMLVDKVLLRRGGGTDAKFTVTILRLEPGFRR
jgi:hypothetical protein